MNCLCIKREEAKQFQNYKDQPRLTRGHTSQKKKVKTKSFLEAKLLATKERRNKSRGVEKQPHYPAPAELSVSVVC
jgi:hypothetical protein